MVFAGGFRNSASAIEGELVGLDAQLQNLGVSGPTFVRPTPRRITTTAGSASPYNSETFRVLDALIAQLRSRLSNAPAEKDVSLIRNRVDEIEERLARERTRQKPI